jgi:antitoxin (DNA-binding transcriptional repressor) of toxin-antitoxin stability system
MEKVISAGEAQRRFPEVLDEIATEGTSFVIEQDGAPVALLVASEAVREVSAARERFFETVSEMAERSAMDPDDADGLAREAVAAARYPA